ncbi:hypothetical protein RHMOL_Rhmol04G0149000 [Rhododendron molle]|uniref:Uncharacterized protein n=1 Tax=Rhododendron molle TaxID=49168 RepID=A0ACC0P311_RHOML|nr:hypothetical protein RHMOL_Rhmol04G0149000 [Rhododendron molle]
MGGKPCVMMFYLIMVLLLLKENNMWHFQAMIIATESPTPQPQPTGNLPMYGATPGSLHPQGRGISTNEYVLQRKTTLMPKLPEAALQLASAGYSVEHPS